MTEKYIVRESTRDDCDEIMRMIRELAEYEKLSDQVNINADILRRDGFGKDKYFQCLVAESTAAGECDNGKHLIGCVIFFYIYSTFKGRACYIEALYVTPSWRGQGIGTTMWAKVTKTALAKGCDILRWTVLDWNTPSIELYKLWGGEDISDKEGWKIFVMHQQAMIDFVAKNGLLQ